VPSSVDRSLEHVAGHEGQDDKGAGLCGHPRSPLPTELVVCDLGSVLDEGRQRPAYRSGPL